jgi:hypothetical protein
MSVAPTVAQQQSQLITEEWMMMHPLSSSSSTTTNTVQPPTFLEIMFLKEAEQYMYTNILPNLITTIHTKYIQPLVHQLLVQLRRQQQQGVEQNDSNESSSIHIHHNWTVQTKIRNLVQRVKKMLHMMLQTYVLPYCLRIVTRINNTLRHQRNGDYALEIIYVLRYIFDRYSLIKYNCTLIELFYGNGTMIRKKVATARKIDRVGQPQQQPHYDPINAATQVVLLPLNHNDQIRTAFVTNVLGYVYDKMMQLPKNHLRIRDLGHQHSSIKDNNNNNNNYYYYWYTIVVPLFISIYQFYNEIYYSYQYLIGTSYYVNLPNRLLQQIVLQRSLAPTIPTSSDRLQNQIQSSTSIPIHPTIPSSLSSSTSTSTSTWYNTVLRTGGVLLLTSCYVTQMIQYYIQRRRTVRQERLVEHQQQQQQQEQQPSRSSNSITIVGLTRTTETNDNVNQSHPTYDDNDASSLQMYVTSSDVELLPVPLLPNNIQHNNGSTSSTLLKSYIKKGYCPICNEPIHRTIHSTDTTFPGNTNSKMDDTNTGITMLYGYVYCSYTCIYQYLLDNDGICPVTGRPVPEIRTILHAGTTIKSTTTDVTDGDQYHPNNNNNAKTPQSSPQLIRLL